MSNANKIIDHLNTMAKHRNIPLDKTNDLKKLLIDDYGNADIDILNQAFDRISRREYLAFHDVEKGVKLHRLPTFTEYKYEIDSIIGNLESKKSLESLILTPDERNEMRRIWRLGNMRMRYVKRNKIDESSDLFNIIFDGKYDNVILKWEKENES